MRARRDGAKQVIQVQCCICHRLRVNGSWVNVPEPPEDAHNLSHTYCPDCARRTFPELWSRIIERVPVIGGLLDTKPGTYDNVI
jgi:hypothetical protein